LNDRMRRVARRFTDARIDALLVTRQAAVRYLTGFTGSTATLVLSRRKAYILVDSRYWEQAETETDGAEVVRLRRGYDPLPKLRAISRPGTSVGFEASHMTVSQRGFFVKKLRGRRLVPTKRLIEDVAAIKDEEEISFIAKASRIAEASLKEVVPMIVPGVRELDIALELEMRMRKRGADGVAFSTIVASGPRSAMPHGVASRRKIGKNEFVTIDFGCTYRGYACDITRTFVVGRASRRMREVYELVHAAQKKGIAAVGPGVKASDVDAAARGVIEAAGYGENFGHGLGHSIGIDVHESPNLYPKSKDVLQSGNVVTVEPGVYIKNFGGVRIEDDVVVTKNGRKVITRLPKKLIEL
jgi:Xaa-Pro aminopeptidase